MIRKINKKGSHVGMILSFVLFITITFFLISVLAPKYKQSDSKRALLTHLNEEIRKKLEANVTYQMVSFEGPIDPGKECATLKSIKDKLEGIDIKKLIIKDSTDVRVVYKNNGNHLKINSTLSPLKLYFSENFQENLDSILACTDFDYESGDNNYTLHQKTEEKYYLLDSIMNFIAEMNNAEKYEALKEEFNLPSGTEFGFGFKDSRGNIILANDVQANTNFYADETSISYMDNNLTLNSGFIRVVVW